MDILATRAPQVAQEHAKSDFAHFENHWVVQLEHAQEWWVRKDKNLHLFRSMTNINRTPQPTIYQGFESHSTEFYPGDITEFDMQV